MIRCVVKVEEHFFSPNYNQPYVIFGSVLFHIVDVERSILWVSENISENKSEAGSPMKSIIF